MTITELLARAKDFEDEATKPRDALADRFIHGHKRDFFAGQNLSTMLQIIEIQQECLEKHKADWHTTHHGCLAECTDICKALDAVNKLCEGVK